jgi:uncharacterized protein YukE
VQDVSLPPIPGDPAGMRALAAALRADATRLAALAAGLLTRVQALEFYGPAADRFDQRMEESSRRVVGLAERLLALAALLESSATEVEAAQRARELKLAEMRREAAQAAAGGSR